MSYSRFAIYYTPPYGPLAQFGAAWLGWDVERGQEAVQPDVPGLHDITMTPRKYGFHATLKPPFRLADGATEDLLFTAVGELAETLAPAECEGLTLSSLGRFMALTLQGDVAGVRRVAGGCVRGLDAFRAPAPPAELARRRQPGLSPRQDTLLQQWGYPYVIEEFRFHMTLTGPLADGAVDDWMTIAKQHLPPLPASFTLDQIALCGERADGRFEMIHRYALTG